jgi:hypothetical protein
MANKSTLLKNLDKSIFSGQSIPDTYQSIQGMINPKAYAANNDGSILAGSTPEIPEPTTTTTTTTTTTSTTTTTTPATP